jgi:hypothetical protein
MTWQITTTSKGALSPKRGCGESPQPLPQDVANHHNLKSRPFEKKEDVANHHNLKKTQTNPSSHKHAQFFTPTHRPIKTPSI